MFKSQKTFSLHSLLLPSLHCTSFCYCWLALHTQIQKNCQVRFCTTNVAYLITQNYEHNVCFSAVLQRLMLTEQLHVLLYSYIKWFLGMTRICLWLFSLLQIADQIQICCYKILGSLYSLGADKSISTDKWVLQSSI